MLGTVRQVGRGHGRGLHVPGSVGDPSASRRQTATARRRSGANITARGQARGAGHACGRGWSVGVCEATGKGRVALETCRQSRGTWNFGVWGSQRSSRKGSKKGASRGPRRKLEARGTAGPGAERRAGAQGPEGPGGPGRSPRRPEALDRALSLGGSGRSPDRTGCGGEGRRGCGASVWRGPWVRLRVAGLGAEGRGPCLPLQTGDDALCTLRTSARLK